MSHPLLNQRAFLTIHQAVANLLGLNLPPHLLFNEQGQMIGVDEGDYTLDEFLRIAGYEDYDKARRFMNKVHDAIAKKKLVLVEVKDKELITMHDFMTWATAEKLLNENEQRHAHSLKDVCELFLTLANQITDVANVIAEKATDYTKTPAIGTTSKNKVINNGQREESIKLRLQLAQKFIDKEIVKLSGLPGFFTTLAFLIEHLNYTDSPEIVAIAKKIKNGGLKESEKKAIIARWLEGKCAESINLTV